MAIDLAQFRETFFEESLEGLDVMESGLLGLEPGSTDLELINRIFRAAHSIKGGAGTFGLTDISRVTHVMETVLDEMRSGKRKVESDAVEVLLKGVDVLRDLIDSARAGCEAEADKIAAIQARLDALLITGSSGHSGDQHSTPSSTTVPTAQAGWEIRFEPETHLFRTGNDPARLFRLLEEIGEVRTEADLSRLPAWNELDPEQAHLKWRLELVGNVARPQIDEIFEWVEGDSRIIVQPIQSSVAPAAEARAVEAAAEPPPAAATNTSKTPGAESTRTADRKAKPSEASSIRVGIEKVDELINMVGELVITQSMLGQLGQDFDMSRIDRLRDGLAQLERNTRELQESVMRIRMVPVNFVFSRFPRLVHDLSSKLNKEVELLISGEQTEVDKTVLEKISDPLVHLVRNSLDHGIETPEAREAKGKPRNGTVKLDAYHHGGSIVIEIKDDGAGINRERVVQKAREKGLISPDAVLSDEQALELIFAPGFSTAEVVSDVSGRGVGMDVVKKNIDSLGGAVSIESKVDKGTTISIRLPLTLAILDGQTIRCGEEKYILPLISIVETVQARKEDVFSVAGGGTVFRLRNEYLTVVRLADLFEIEEARRNFTEGLVVVVEGGGQRIGLFVDDLQSQQQIVIKSLESNFRRVDGISGATILGDGTVALILDVAGLTKMTGATSSSRNNGRNENGENRTEGAHS